MCKLCETKPVYEFTNQRKLCARCFINYFQKKVLYIIRKFEMIKSGDVIAYENKGDFRGVVLEDVLKMFSEKAMIDIHRSPATTLKKQLTKSKKSNKVAISSTIDTESDILVHELIKGNTKNLKGLAPVQGKIIKPLYLFLDEEVLLYAKLRKLKYTKNLQANFGATKSKTAPAHRTSKQDFVGKNSIEKKDKISEFINDLEKKHPEIKRAIINSYLELYC